MPNNRNLPAPPIAVALYDTEKGSVDADCVGRNLGPLLQGSAGPEAARTAFRRLAALVNETGQVALFAKHDGRVVDGFPPDSREKSKV